PAALDERKRSMTDSVTPPRSRWPGRLLYLATILVTAAVTYGVVALLMNINERKQEAKQHYLKIVELNEEVIDPAEWGKNFPPGAGRLQAHRREHVAPPRRQRGDFQTRRGPAPEANFRRLSLQRGLPRAPRARLHA